MTLRSLIAATVAVTILAGAAARAAAPSELPSATVALSTHRAGAHPTVLVLRLRYEMQCGWPGFGPLTLRFPAAMIVPPSLRRSNVLVDGRRARRLMSNGHRVVVALPLRPQILCDVIAPGALTITFTRGAGLQNPRRPGRYELRGNEQELEFSALLVIR